MEQKKQMVVMSIAGAIGIIAGSLFYLFIVGVPFPIVLIIFVSSAIIYGITLAIGFKHRNKETWQKSEFRKKLVKIFLCIISFLAPIVTIHGFYTNDYSEIIIGIGMVIGFITLLFNRRNL